MAGERAREALGSLSVQPYFHLLTTRVFTDFIRNYRIFARNIMSSRVSVSISAASSGEGLQEAIDAVADKRGMSRSKLVAKILVYAVNNNNKFDEALQTARPKPGKAISASVHVSVRDRLTEWAESRGTTRTRFACFVLEKALEDDLVEAALKYKTKPTTKRTDDDDDEDDEA